MDYDERELVKGVVMTITGIERSIKTVLNSSKVFKNFDLYVSSKIKSLIDNNNFEASDFGVSEIIENTEFEDREFQILMK